MRDDAYWPSLIHELRALPDDVQREYMTNTSLRERFGIDVKNSATASRLLREALAAGSVRLQDPDAPPKLRRYVPSWA